MQISTFAAADAAPAALVGTPRRAAAVRDAAVSYPALDWLRFGLASVVALGHSGLIGWHGAGQLAVQVFFALSGWLIGGILLRSTAADLPRFFYNRGTRIWVPYFIAVALVYSVSALRDPVTLRWLEFLAYDLTFTHNLYFLQPDPVTARPFLPLDGTGNHFWSIAVEEQFYLAAPLLMIVCPWGKSFWLWAAIACGAVGSGSWFGAISLGVLAAISRERFGTWYLQPAGRLAVLAALCVAGLVLARGAPLPLAAPFFAGLAVLALAQEGRRSAAGELFGGLSYPLYLNHWVAVFAVHAVFDQLGLARSAAGEIVAYALAVLGAGLHFLVIDRTILARRGRLFTEARGRALQVLAFSLFALGVALGTLSWGAPFLG